MRTSLVIFGVIFLVIGGLLYLVPLQEITADTITEASGDIDTRTSSASVTVPAEWSYASGIIGLILLTLGLFIPNTHVRNDSKKESYDTVVESEENIKVGDGNERKIVREQTERYKTRED